MRVTITERRAVLKAMDAHGCRSPLSGMEVDRIAHRTPGERGTMGVERTRRCLAEEMALVPRRVARTRGWGTQYRYYLTTEGIEWLRPKS